MSALHLPNNALIPLLIGDGSTTPDTDTSGDTVGAYLTGENGTSILVGTTAGSTANIQLTINLDLSTSGIDPGEYYLEVIADQGGANPKTLIPNPTGTDNPQTVIVDDILALP